MNLEELLTEETLKDIEFLEEQFENEDLEEGFNALRKKAEKRHRNFHKN